MSLSSFLICFTRGIGHNLAEDPDTFFTRLDESNRELLNQMDQALQNDQIDELIRLAEERHTLFEEAGNLATDNTQRVYLRAMQSDANVQQMLFQIMKDFGEQIAAVFTRLDNLENDVRAINERLNSGQR